MVPWLTMHRLAALLLTFLSLPALAQFRESVTVARILLDVRVTDFDGDSILGLEPADFEVTIGGKKAEVLSATWVSESVSSPAESRDPLIELEAGASAGDPSTSLGMTEGRLFVFFIQTDFGRNTERIRGQMHFFKYAEELLEMLEPDDRVAVFSFDSHLKFRLDFTSDKEQILAAMRDAITINTPPWPPVVPNPSLASRLDREEMKKAADSEGALVLVGNALRHIPGPKSMMLMGWGLGELMAGGGVRMKPRYKFARRALDAARVTIFALDTTFADYHSLEVGLGKAAEDTGGFYAKTHVFPQHALERLRRTLAGHYELELRRPDALKPGTHDLIVRVKRRGVRVLAPSSWMDR
jgi:VWFA-related protein